MTDAQAALLTDAVNRLTDSANLIFSLPDSSQLAAVWGFGFAMPLTIYLVAYVVGVLVNFWRR